MSATSTSPNTTVPHCSPSASPSASTNFQSQFPVPELHHPALPVPLLAPLQGQLAGDRANLVAILKVVGPIFYGKLFLVGKQMQLPQLPFIVSCALLFCALVLSPLAFAA